MLGGLVTDACLSSLIMLVTYLHVSPKAIQKASEVIGVGEGGVRGGGEGGRSGRSCGGCEGVGRYGLGAGGSGGGGRRRQWQAVASMRRRHCMR